MINYIKNNPIINKLLYFMESRAFPVLIALIAFLSSVFGMDLFGFYTIVFLGIFLCFFTSDTISFVPVVLYVYFCVSTKFGPQSVEYDYYTSVPVLIQLISIFIAGMLSILFCAVRIHKERKNDDKPKASFVFLKGIIFLCLALLFNGLNIYFSFMNLSSNYRIINLVMGIVISASLFIFYFFFTYTIKPNRNLVERLAEIVMIAGILISAEVLTNSIIQYINGTLFVSGTHEIDRFAVALGWGNPNVIAGMLVIMIPLTLYLATVKKHGWIYCLIAIGLYLVSMLLLSRGAILVAGIILAIGLVVNCIKGKNRKTCRIVIAAVFGIGICITTVFYDHITELFGRVFRDGLIIDPITGELADSSRFDLWKQGWDLFLKAPIFGGGFTEPIIYGSNNPQNIFYNLYHNIIIQMLAACGVVGFFALLFHFFQIVRTCLKGITLQRFYIALSIALLIGLSLFDNYFFYPFFGLYYSIFLMSADLDYKLMNIEMT